MTWKEALEAVIVRTKHEVLRSQCADNNPNVEQRNGCRKMVVQMASSLADPSLMEKTMNAAGAVARAAVAVATGQPVLVSAEIRAERQSTCDVCEHYEPKQARCKICGCGGLKLDLATERCPIGKWEAQPGE